MFLTPKELWNIYCLHMIMCRISHYACWLKYSEAVFSDSGEESVFLENNNNETP